MNNAILVVNKSLRELNSKVEFDIPINKSYSDAIKKLIRENKNLHDKIEEFKHDKLIITKENADLKSYIATIQSKLVENEKMADDINLKNDKIFNLLNKISEKEEKHNEKLREINENYEHDLLKAKMEQETNKHKIENFSKMTILNDILYNKVLILEKKLIEEKNNFEEKLNYRELEFMNKMDKYKNKMLGFLKLQAQKSNEEENNKVKLNMKLDQIHIKELIDEIEIQNNIVDNLLKERYILKKEIEHFIYDIKLSKSVMVDLTKKNMDFRKKLEYLSVPIKNNRFKSKIFKNVKNNSIDVSPNKFIVNVKRKPSNIFETPKKLPSHMNSLIRKSGDNFLFNNLNSIEHHNTTSGGFFSKNKLTKKPIKNQAIPLLTTENNLNSEISKSYYNTKSQIKNKILNSNDIEVLEKKVEKYKDLYEYYRDLYTTIKTKYTNIFKIYNEALEKIYKEDIMKNNNNNEIKININDFKNFNFEEMDYSQKYSILIKLINNISPLVFQKDFENHVFSGDVFNVKEKYYIKDKSMNFSSTQNSVDCGSNNKKTVASSFSQDSKKQVNNVIERIKGHKINFHGIKRHKADISLNFSNNKIYKEVRRDINIQKLISNVGEIHDSPFADL